MQYPHPRLKQRSGKHPYIFKELTDFKYASHWQLKAPFMSQWLEISVDGLITVKANQTGYSWDGCTPKYSFLDLAIVGVPDGHIDVRTMKPLTYYASMVHDALYQYLDSVPVSKQQIDQQFLRMLGDFRLRYVYYLGVKWLGGRGVVQNGLQAAGAKHAA